MGLASSMLCLIGTETGLTYSNLLLINLIAAVLYTIIVSVPKIRELFNQALPKQVRAGLPIAVGLIFAFTALQMSGFVTTKTVNKLSWINGFSALSSGRKLGLYALIGAVTAVIICIILKLCKRKHPVILSFTGGTLVFILLDVILVGMNTGNTESFLNFGRIWIAAGSQASQTTPFADSYLTYSMTAIADVFKNMGQVFTEGFDFSGCTDNSIVIIINCIVSYLLMGLYDAEGTILLVTGNKSNTALLCNAGTNILAPFFGVGGVSISKTSLAAKEDHGKSGIVSLVACIGFLISLFIMAFPMLFATMTYGVGSMNEWNYFAYGNGGFVYLMKNTLFGIADIVMVCLGVSTLSNLKNWDWKKVMDWIPGVVTVLIALLFTNIAYGVAAGVIAFLLTRLFSFKKAVIKEIKLSTIVLMMFLLIIVIL